MRIDLHCHSKHSKRASLWFMNKIGCPESFAEPEDIYHRARGRGMDAVTLTDHNVIGGCLEIGHLPDTFISCEYTTYFPEDRCKLHVLCYDITEAQHHDLNRVRENVFDFVHYLREANIAHVCAHPLYGVNERLAPHHVERLLLLFDTLELNGDVHPDMNAALLQLTSQLDASMLARLAVKHDCAPQSVDSWRKNVVAGSDDHSLHEVGSSWTDVPGATTFDEFWEGVVRGQAKRHTHNATPLAFGRHVYSTAYQFYKPKFDLERYLHKDLLVRFLEHALMDSTVDAEPFMARFYLRLSKRRNDRNNAKGTSLFGIVRREAGKLIAQDPRLMAIVRSSDGSRSDMDEKWFDFMNHVSGKTLFGLGQHFVDCIARAHVGELFSSVGSAGALYLLLAPYLVGFSTFRKQCNDAASVLKHFDVAKPGTDSAQAQARLAHFTDTYYDVNGVAKTLHQQLELAQQLGKDYTIMTCFSEKRPFERGVRRYDPIGTYPLPEYAELSLQIPPFLQVLSDCYEANYSQIHVATPGPVGLTGLAVARILKLPVAGTYHTSFPQYVRLLTEDAYVEDLCWRYMMWFYDQMDTVYVPSRATGAELIDKGLAESKVQVYPRGVDTELFHPAKRNNVFQEQFGVSSNELVLLYVGRVSHDKNLDYLETAYRNLLKDGVGVRLVVVGDGPYRTTMETALKGTDAVFTGYLHGEQLRSAYASGDIFVFPSVTDTFGNVVLEAQASGCPVIVSDVGGPQENVLDSETGFIVPAHDAGALSEKVALLAGDDALRKRMGLAARRYTEGRSFEHAFEAFWDMIVREGACDIENKRAPGLAGNALSSWVSAIA